MKITFEMSFTVEPISAEEFEAFETLIGHTFPEDYKQHMLTYNGGDVEKGGNAHVSDPEGGSGIAYFYPIKYGVDLKMEELNAKTELESLGIPTGYFIIGTTHGGGEIIMSLNNDATYGNTKEYYPDGSIYDLSPSFTQLLNDQVEQIE